MRRIVALGALLVLAPVARPAAPVGGATPTAPSAAADGPLRVVNYNILHGSFCNDGSDCQAPDRVDLFLRQLESAGCPEVVGLQEVNDNLRALLAARIDSRCGGRYRAVFTDADGNDREYVLTTLRPRGPRIVLLQGRFRSASRVELSSPLGPVVLVVTHQDSDAVFPACRSDIARYRCPPPCPDGTTYPDCQTIVGERLADRGGPARAIRIYMGDFNTTPGSPRYATLVANGWIDSHLAAGNAECDPATGSHCTAGRDDKSIAVLKDPTARQQERIDFIFVKPGPRCVPAFGPPGDPDGFGTGLFASTPAPDGPGGLAWPSDHTAVSMDLTCRPAGRA